MSIASEITRIKTNIANAYTACGNKGGTLPQTQNSANLAATISGISGSENITWHQCPEPVRKYLDYLAAHPYDPSDYSYTEILSTDHGAPADVNLANTKPVGKTIGGVTFCDNEPCVAVPFAVANSAGTLTFLDKLRWINTTYITEAGAAYPRGANTRDIGGWSCGTGSDGNPCTVKYGMIIRGGEPNVADRELMVDKLGIKSELQLLPTREQSADRLKKSVWHIDWYGNETENTSVYGIDGTEANRKLWQTFLGAVLRSTAAGKPIYVHCGIGADRTGAVMIMLEALLGMSENEIAQDYELTNFAFYQDATTPRRRNNSFFEPYLTAIKSVQLVSGLPDTLAGHAASFALSLGFTADEINAFRVACTNGSPVPFAPVLTTYAVTKSGSHVVYSNSAQSVEQFRDYETTLTPEIGYVITGVSVTMSGADITAAVFTGTEKIITHTVSKTLGASEINNGRESVRDGESYAAIITPNTDYAISSVTVTMGGTDITASAVALVE